MAIKISPRIAAKKFATQNGFDTIRHEKAWQGFEAFGASNKSDNYERVGYPTFILVDANNIARLASHDETFAIMGITHCGSVEGDSFFSA